MGIHIKLGIVENDGGLLAKKQNTGRKAFVALEGVGGYPIRI